MTGSGDQRRVAFLGPEFSFSHLALMPLLGELVAEAIPAGSVREAITLVETGAAEWAFVAVETNLRGTVHDHLAALVESSLLARRQVVYRAVLGLAARVPLEGVTAVASHPHALEECERWLGEHLPGVERRPMESTAAAAAAAGGESGLAAICSLPAAERNGLDVLVGDVSDEPGDITRFLLAGAPVHSNQGQTGLVVSMIRLQPRADAASLDAALSAIATIDSAVVRFETAAARARLGDYEISVDVAHAADSSYLEAVARRADDAGYDLTWHGDFAEGDR